MEFEKSAEKPGAIGGKVGEGEKRDGDIFDLKGERI